MITGVDRSQRRYHAAAHAAQRLILEQHRELRRLLALGLVHTCLPSRDRQSRPAALRVLVGELRTVFVAHLSDEEAAALPLLDDHRLGGPRRTQILREEHARQRQEVEALHALSETESGDALAERFDALARTLLTDIAEEERAFALTVALLDEHAVRPCDITPRPIPPRKHHESRARSFASTATG